MKARLLVIPLFLLLIAFFSLPVSAEGEDSLGQTMPDEYTDLLDGLPEELRELLPDGLYSNSTEEVGRTVEEMSSFSYLANAVLTMLGAALPECAVLLASLCGILILSALSRSVSTSLGRSQPAFALCSSLVIKGLLFANCITRFEEVSLYLDRLRGLTRMTLPLSAALYTIGGNVAQAVASTASLSVYLAILDELVTRSIFPFLGICMALLLLQSVSNAPRTDLLLSTLKSNYTLLLSFLMMLLLAMLSSRSLLAARSDSLLLHSAKFAAGKFIPVVGGSVSELLRTLSSGVGYLRGTVGICGVLLLLLTLLPTVIRLFLLRIVWQIAASIGELLGCESEKKLLSEFSSLGGYLIAVVSVLSSVLLIALIVLAKSVAAV